MSEDTLQHNDEISLKELILKAKEWFHYLKSQWLKIVFTAFIGGVFGIVYAYIQPITYTAKTTFVVEDSKSGSGLSSLASLAGQFGVDVGSNAGGGLISGDNILLYFKSESLIREVLLSSWDNKHSFADKYVEITGIKKSWQKKEEWKTFKLSSHQMNSFMNRKTDSILKLLITIITKEELQINRIDKKAGFLELTTTMLDEAFSKRFNEQLVQTAIGQYVHLKTDRQKKTVDRLQSRADSIAGLLNQKTSAAASLQTQVSTMDMNPLYRTTSAVKTELTTRDKTMLGSIYIEVVKNLEMAKFTLNQETPVIQIVDQPIYPLQKNKKSKLTNGIMGIILFSFLAILLLAIKRVFKEMELISN